MILSEMETQAGNTDAYPSNRIEAVMLITRIDLHRRLMLAKHYIESNYHKEISLKQIAREVGISEFHFSRTFRKLFLITPHQYLLKTRMHHAEKLLRSGNLSVSEVANAVGYSDLFSFSKSFKKNVGISPSYLVKGPPVYRYN